MANAKNGGAAVVDLLAKAVEAGDLAVESGEVKITAKASPDGKEHKREYRKYSALTLEGALLLCGGKMEPATAKPEGDDVKDERTPEQKRAGVLDHFSYGFDLDVRSTIRSQIMGTLEDPEKAIKKAVDALVGSGFDAADARAMVLAQRKKAGLPIPE